MVCPSTCAILGATARARMSLPPPGANGTMSVMGFCCGKAVCAAAGSASVVSSAAASVNTAQRLLTMFRTVVSFVEWICSATRVDGCAFLCKSLAAFDAVFRVPKHTPVQLGELLGVDFAQVLRLPRK